MRASEVVDAPLDRPTVVFEVVVLDDHLLVRQLVKILLERDARIRVSTSTDDIDLVRDAAADVIVFEPLTFSAPEVMRARAGSHARLVAFTDDPVPSISGVDAVVDKAEFELLSPTVCQVLGLDEV